MISVAYFTNPHIHWPDQRAQAHFWEDFLAQQLPYHRGFIYFLRLNARILEHSNGILSLDNAVRDFTVLRLAGSRHDSARWVEMLDTKFLPPNEAYQEYQSMVSGEVVRPYGQGDLNIGLKMHRTSCERFDLGFDMSSLNSRIVTGLRASSRAAQSGLREGDCITVISDLEMSLRNTSKNFTLEVTRNNLASNITFLPRSFDAVECYLWTS